MADEPTVVTTPSSPAPAAPSPSPAAPVATAPAIPASIPSPTTTTPTAPSRPDWLPAQFFDATKGPNLDEFGKHYSEVATRDAAEQVRRLALPQKPEDVKIELPKDFQLPQGVEFKLDPAKPEFSKLQAAAVKHGLSADTVSDLVGVYAETLVNSQATIAAAHAAEIAKLGANGPARVTALGTFFDGIGAGELKQMLVTAGMVQAAEKLVSKFSSQGVASFSQAHREPGPAGGKLSDEAYQRLSPAAKLDYARGFDQTQFQKAG